MKRRKLLLITIVFAVVTLFSACSQSSNDMHDGYYSAEMASFDEHSWKEYLTICVSDDRIITVEYNAKNASGLIKSWDMNYMRTMRGVTGTYPNEYTRTYASSLLNLQDASEVDAVTGATHSYHNFQALAEAAIAQARAGDKQVALVEMPESDDEAAEG